MLVYSISKEVYKRLNKRDKGKKGYSSNRPMLIYAGVNPIERAKLSMVRLTPIFKLVTKRLHGVHLIV